MYVAIAVVFVTLSGLWLHPLVLGEHRMRRFYGAFVPAFLAYAVIALELLGGIALILGIYAPLVALPLALEKLGHETALILPA